VQNGPFRQVCAAAPVRYLQLQESENAAADSGIESKGKATCDQFLVLNVIHDAAAAAAFEKIFHVPQHATASKGAQNIWRAALALVTVRKVHVMVSVHEVDVNVFESNNERPQIRRRDRFGMKFIPTKRGQECSPVGEFLVGECACRRTLDPHGEAMVEECWNVVGYDGCAIFMVCSFCA